MQINRREFLTGAAAGTMAWLGRAAATSAASLVRFVAPVFDIPDPSSRLRFAGVIGQRIAANLDNWLLVAPVANPAIVEMFRDRNQAGPDPNCRHASCRLLPWSGEFAGKYLISGVQALTATDSAPLRETLQALVDALIAYQAPDGYLGPFESGQQLTGRAPGGDALWDLWGQYHCMLGLYRWYGATGDQRALQACLRAADLFCARFIDQGVSVAQAGAPAMNQSAAHVLTLLYQETGLTRYLELIGRFERSWSTTGGNFVFGFQHGEPFHAGTQPRWESLHAVQAVVELWFITGDTRYRTAAMQIWRSIRDRDRHINGGFTSLEQATGNPYDPRPIETCGTIAWMALCVDVLRMSGDSMVADELELSTWNALLGAQHPDGRWWTYNTPMGGIPTTGMPPMSLPPPMNDQPWYLGERVPARFDIGWQDRPGAEYLSCCAANGPRGLGNLSEWALMRAASGVVLNHFGPSTLSTTLPSGRAITLTQATSYPIGGRILIRLGLASAERFTLRIRIPQWSAKSRIAVNGTASTNPRAGRYVALRRVWKDGDRIELNLDMRVRVLAGQAPPPGSRSDGSAEGRIALYRGPLLLCYDARFDVYPPAQLPSIDTSKPPRLVPVSAYDPRPLLLARFRTTAGESITLCDFASAGRAGTHVDPGLPDVSRPWQFARADGTILAPIVRLLPDGTISGSTHPNEARWAVEDGKLAFFAQAGGVTTRFLWSATESGRRILRGRTAFDPAITHVLSELSFDYARSPWHFGRADGSSIADRLTLNADGTITGAIHPNESRWGTEGDTLVFYAANGAASTRFDEIRTGHGRMILRGRFLFDSTITHVLSELDLEFRNKIWQFWSSLFPVSLRLLSDGTIDGSIHPNETRWGFGGGHLVFYAADGRASTRFDTLRNEHGKMVLTGDFLFNPAIKHKLIEHNLDLGWTQGSAYLSWLPGA